MYSYTDTFPDTTLDPSVREVLTGDNYNERLRAVVYTMPETLSDSEYLALQNYLLTTQDGRDGDFRQHEYALRNYIMDALREEQTRLYETIDTLTDIYSNEAQGEVMRNYALQHLASAYIDNVSGLSANDKSRIVTTLQAALNGKQSLPGTALVGLQDISRWDPAILSPSRVGNIAMDILSDQDANKLSRISAFQISGELKLNGVSSYARDVAFDEKADRALRMSAIYALGQLGQTTGLDSLLNDANKYVSNAAQAALNVKR